jgi:hypothetical protein
MCSNVISYKSPKNDVSQATNSNVYISGVEDLILKEIRDEKKGKLMLDTLIKKVGE